MRVLSWLTHAVKPMTVDQFQQALAVDSNTRVLDEGNLVEEEDIISVCGGIVTVEEESQLIRFIHYTTQEYLENIRENIFPSAQLDIVKACITFLSQDKVIKRRDQLSFFYYAARNWGSHAAGEVQIITPRTNNRIYSK